MSNHIDNIINAVQALNVADRETLVARLQTVTAAETKAAVEKRRLASIRAAQSNPNLQVAFKSSLRGLARLGLELDRLVASADGLGDVNRAMDAAGWVMSERIQLKTSLAGIGVLD
jgi:hypothetical protein